MKKRNKLFICFVFTGILIISGCICTRYVYVDDCIPEWFLSPPTAEDAIYGTGQAAKANAALAQKAADTRAIQTVSEQVISKVKSYVKDFLQGVGFAGEGQINELTSSTVKILSQTTLEGARISERAPCGTTWYSLCEYKKDNAAKLISSTLKSEMEKQNLRDKFEAFKSFNELEEEIKKAFDE